MSATTNQEPKEYTPEELKEMRDKSLNYYKMQNDLLKEQCAFEEYTARIQKARFEALESKVKYVQLRSSLEQQAKGEQEIESEDESLKTEE